MRRGNRSDLIAFDGLRYAPENELGVVLLFGKLHKTLGFPEFDAIQPSFPDCWAFQKTVSGTRPVWIEFEFRSHSFKSHAKRLRALKPKRGIVVCWEHDWLGAEKYADIIELKTAVGYGKRVWIQCTNPEYQGGLDEAPRRRKTRWEWTVAPRARPRDIVLLYRSGAKASARHYGVDESLLQSVANIYEVTSLPQSEKKWGQFAYVRQLALLREPLRLEHLREDMYLKALKATERAAVRDAMEKHLRHEPAKTSRSRIKRLRGVRRPQYRLRVEDIRVFYDVTDEAVEVLAIVAKSEAAAWLERHGEPEKETAAEQGESKP
jgi:mRNA interferase RelE/StbE